MATSHNSGKNNSGVYLFRRDEKGNQIDEDGSPVTETGRPAAIDHDLDEIAEAFNAWGHTQRLHFLLEE